MKKRSTPLSPRRRPSQARSKVTVDFVLEAAARVFRREGFGATTNRIAKEAGVSIGSLYEYFPNKHALLAALAERHVALAEQELRDVLRRAPATEQLLAELQRAIIASHRFPSQAIALIASDHETQNALQHRSASLRNEVMDALVQRAQHLPEPALAARAVFGVIGELTARSFYELDQAEHAKFAQQLLKMALSYLR